MRRRKKREKKREIYAIEKCVANAQYTRAHMGMGHHNGEIKA